MVPIGVPPSDDGIQLDRDQPTGDPPLPPIVPEKLRRSLSRMPDGDQELLHGGQWSDDHNSLG